jgi:hypothetical protein
MAYMSQEKKQSIHAKLKAAIPASWKWSLAVRNHSTIVLTIASAPADIPAHMIETIRAAGREINHTPTDVNPYHWHEQFSGELLETFNKIFDALNDGNHDRSDYTTDYFDVGWYVDVSLGRWDKKFVVTPVNN